MSVLRRFLLTGYRAGYERVMRPLLFRQSAQDSHEQVLGWLQTADQHEWLNRLGHWLSGLVFEKHPFTVGGVILPHPLILAAGFVKGAGFEDETAALRAVERGDNIIPGWRSMPRLVGAVEFGSFTRWPQLGNPGMVMWRDAPSRSTQNRVGLKNPGAKAAAAFLAARADLLPACYGINIAVSPGLTDPMQEGEEVLQALDCFLEQGIRPSWFTLNLSCPNTEDDPGGHQTDEKARYLCGAMAHRLQNIPLWVKISPNLAQEQYRALLRAFADTGVKAVIATNTLAMPAPGQSTLMAGVGGGKLHECALHAARWLMDERRRGGYKVDVIGCGGVMDGASYRTYTELGIQAMQYWSALIYRGPLAAAVMIEEA